MCSPVIPLVFRWTSFRRELEERCVLALDLDSSILPVQTNGLEVQHFFPSNLSPAASSGDAYWYDAAVSYHRLSFDATSRCTRCFPRARLQLFYCFSCSDTLVY